MPSTCMWKIELTNFGSITYKKKKKKKLQPFLKTSHKVCFCFGCKALSLLKISVEVQSKKQLSELDSKRKILFFFG